MITCVNDKETIDKNFFVSDYGNFSIEFSNGRKFLYQRAAIDDDSYKFTYMRIYEHLGKTVFDFCIIDKDKTTFKNIISLQYIHYKGQCTYDIYKVSKIKFPNLDVMYSY